MRIPPELKYVALSILAFLSFPALTYLRGVRDMPLLITVTVAPWLLIAYVVYENKKARRATPGIRRFSGFLYPAVLDTFKGDNILRHGYADQPTFLLPNKREIKISAPLSYEEVDTLYGETTPAQLSRKLYPILRVSSSDYICVSGRLIDYGRVYLVSFNVHEGQELAVAACPEEFVRGWTLIQNE